ncbi:hypothetical protein EST38_g3172 [Candolleomyces aberdarensis]|uniref:Copper homeostasis protein cutC homolog n=1 Tax=Candolleomyces aberdarensis TaxID=2316362 RepID=A0A4Q2DSP3_9AGAR|nr:hypothetical protein EST38_g3172 [Candolleomyces aberdarensis]
MEVVEEAVPSLLIEVCVDSVESAVNAVHGGADRLEVCANLGVGGGTTPSPGLVRSIQKAVKDSVPLMVMIRPRVGDFRYSYHEIEVMLSDIASFKELGVRGFVVGALSEDGRVDIETMKRAFDMTRDPEEALSDIIEIGGISRVLTSGHAARAPESITMLESLFDTARKMTGHDLWGLTLMPGSGVNSKTVTPVVQQLLPKGLREIHLSGGRWAESHMHFRRDGSGFGASPENEWRNWKTSRKEIQRVREAADLAWDTYWDKIGQQARPILKDSSES